MRRRRRLRPYLAALRGQLRTATHFRVNLLAWFLEGPLHVGILCLLWRVVYLATDRVGGFAYSDMIRYVLVVYLLRRVFSSVETVNFEVWSEINQGKLDAYLVRPICFGAFKFFASLASPAVELALGLPFFLVASAVLGLSVQGDPQVLALFALSVSAAFALLFLVQFLIGSLTFWTERIFGFRDILYSLFILCSGQLIPLSALPRWVQTASYWLPFSGIYFAPASIYAQTELSSQALELFAGQLAWLVVLGGVAALVWSRGVARYASQGG